MLGCMADVLNFTFAKQMPFPPKITGLLMLWGFLAVFTMFRHRDVMLADIFCLFSPDSYRSQGQAALKCATFAY